MSCMQKNDKPQGSIVLRVVEGLLNQEKYMLLKQLAMQLQSESKIRLLVIPVSPDDADTLQKMVTAAAFFIDERIVGLMQDNGCCEIMLKKLCIALKYAILNYKMVVETPDGREERDCAFSIVTPAAHIHVPQNINDKKTERFISSALAEAIKLHNGKESEYLIYHDYEYDKMISERKDDYVRRKYFES